MLLKLLLFQAPVDLAGKFNLPVLNVLWRVTVGESFEYSDQRLQDILHNMGELFKKLANPTSIFAVTYPWLFKIFPNLFQRQLDIKVNRDIRYVVFLHNITCVFIIKLLFLCHMDTRKDIFRKA